jgi:hypothetical protein
MGSGANTKVFRVDRALFYVPLPFMTACATFRAFHDLKLGQSISFAIFSTVVVLVYLGFVRFFEGQSDHKLPVIRNGRLALYFVLWLGPLIAMFVGICSLFTQFQFMTWLNCVVMVCMTPFLAGLLIKDAKNAEG